MHVREQIKHQCSSEHIPGEYVFLKNVGRALARVNASQEIELKVKNFQPPEMFLLEIDQDIMDNYFGKLSSSLQLKQKKAQQAAALNSVNSFNELSSASSLKTMLTNSPLNYQSTKLNGIEDYDKAYEFSHISEVNNEALGNGESASSSSYYNNIAEIDAIKYFVFMHAAFFCFVFFSYR